MSKPVRSKNLYFLLVFTVTIWLASCDQEKAPAPTETATASAIATPAPEPMGSAYVSATYPNLFSDLLGKSDEEVEVKLNSAWEQLFHGSPSSQAIYYPVGDDMAYIKDIGNDDIRSEGMSYGMMIAVQMDKKDEFDRIWRWAKTYMYHEEGEYAGYFSWHNNEDGSQIDANPASDGEAWMVMALFFAAHRWVDAAVKSRAFWKTAAHPETGLFPDYAEFDGTPTDLGESDYHKVFRFDAWRNGMNIAMDYIWFAEEEWAIEQSNRWLDFFVNEGLDSYVNQYTLEGEPLSTDRSPGLLAMNAVAALAAGHPQRAKFVQALWDLRVPSGRWRYYDGMLYMLALLQTSGNFQVYGPGTDS